MKPKFNLDGSLKIPEDLIKENEDSERMFKIKRAIKIKIFQISSKVPAECELILENLDI